VKRRSRGSRSARISHSAAAESPAFGGPALLWRAHGSGSSAASRPGDRCRLAIAAAVALILACAGAPAPEPREPELPALALSSPPAADRLPQRVLLVSIAGLRPAHYHSDEASLGGVRAGRLMPTLSQLAVAGSFADEMVPVTPAAVYPAHASLVTGLSPKRHKIVADWGLDERGLLTADLRRADRLHGVALWRAARDHRLPVVALAWPSTAGAPIDLLLPDLMPQESDESWLLALDSGATPWILDRMRRIEPALEAGGWPSARSLDSLVTRLACEIAAEQRTPALWLLRYGQTGEALMLYGPDSEGAREALARVDRELSSLIDCLRAGDLLETSALVLVGDRALFPVHTRVDPNAVLMDVGLITPPTSGLVAGVHSWAAIAHSHGGAAVVYAEDESAALLARRALEIEAERTRAFRAVSARELRALGADPLAWFGLEAAPGFVFGIGTQGPILRAAELRGAGGYLPSRSGSGVGFVAWGAGLRSGVRVPSMRQIDVAPTVAALLGLDLEGAQGQPLIGVLCVDPRTGRRAPR